MKSLNKKTNGDFMNSPRLEICIEGYDIEQTDFYISLLIEKNEQINKLYEEAKEQIALLTETNEKLHKDFLTLTKQFSETVSSTDSIVLEKLRNIEMKIDKNLTAASNASSISKIYETLDISENIANDRTEECVNKNITDIKNEIYDLKKLFSENV